MKKTVTLSLLLLGTISTNAFAIVRPECGDNTTCFDITNGQRCTTVCPTCDQVTLGCPCCIEYDTTVSCTCNSGYHSATNSIYGCECKKNCAAGYYGDGTTCTKCPTPGTTTGYAQTITDCYVPQNTSVTDSSGTYNYSSNCKYSL